MKTKLKFFKFLLPLLVFAFVAASVTALGSSVKKVTKVNNKKLTLPTLGSFENLQKLLKNYTDNNYYNLYDGGIMYKGSVKGIGVGADSLGSTSTNSTVNSAASETNSQTADFSTTNIQVKGVDEADVVKTDGKYIYQINNNKIVIFDVKSNKEMKIASTINFDTSNFSPEEMYIDDKFLVAIGNSYESSPIIENSKKSIKGYTPYYANSLSKIFIYDISDRSNIKKLREIDVDGDYVSSRKIGSNIYLLSNHRINYYHYRNSDDNSDPASITPYYRDTAIGKDYLNIDYNKIKYFPDAVEPNYIILAGIDLNKMNQKANISTYLGSGENMYVSLNNMYVAVSKYTSKRTNNTGINGGFYYNPGKKSTVIYKFELSNGSTQYAANGEVNGTILNQYSMDEDKNYFRIATTSGDLFATGENQSENNLYVLDSNLKLTGKIENIAPTEKIYSVRFIGDRGYIVTFKKVDPLFVLDLKDPKKPTILGKLKIPGYSDYLHPYDENHIIGFGKDTIDPSKEDVEEGDIQRAYYQGMKIALFDVSDVNHPIEDFKTVIGDRGTDSELLSNPKALLFSKEKNLLAFPVTVMEKSKNTVNNNGKPDNSIEKITEYGTFSFQGAYIYNLDLKDGFKLRGRITHLSDQDYLKSGDYSSPDYNKNVQRVLYIGNTLYTLSNSMLKANDLVTLKEIGNVEVK